LQCNILQEEIACEFSSVLLKATQEFISDMHSLHS
jgi:hypothetical protein